MHRPIHFCLLTARTAQLKNQTNARRTHTLSHNVSAILKYLNLMNKTYCKLSTLLYSLNILQLLLHNLQLYNLYVSLSLGKKNTVCVIWFLLSLFFCLQIYLVYEIISIIYPSASAPTMHVWSRMRSHTTARFHHHVGHVLSCGQPIMVHVHQL